MSDYQEMFDSFQAEVDRLQADLSTETLRADAAKALLSIWKNKAQPVLDAAAKFSRENSKAELCRGYAYYELIEAVEAMDEHND